MSKKFKTQNPIKKAILWPFRSFLRLLIVVIFFGLWQYHSIEVDVLAREVRKLESERNQLKNDSDRLQVQIDQLTNINRIDLIAKEKFGMIGGATEIENLVISGYKPVYENSNSQEKEKVNLAGVQ